MTLEQIAQRAETADQTPVSYILGAGTSHADAPVPWTTHKDADGTVHTRACDCSAFACWASGVNKDDAGTWYGTDRIVADAKSVQKRWKQLDKPARGCCVVYPGSRRADGTWHYGHVGVVVDAGGEVTIDCASTPYKIGGDAITRRANLSFFWSNPDVIFVVPVDAAAT